MTTTTTSQVELDLTKTQIEFLKCKDRGAIFTGGIGAGKTYVLCLKAITRVMEKKRCCIISFSYPALRDVVLDTCRKILHRLGLVADIDYTIKTSEMIIEIWGTQLLLRSGDREDSLRGLNLDDVYIDEAREWTDDTLFNVLLGRIRQSQDGIWRIATTSRGRNWVHNLSQSPDVKTFKQSTFANPFLPRSYKDELKARYTTNYAAQELYAEIVEMGAGVINPMWFKIIDTAPVQQAVRFWDLAVSTKVASDNSSGALCSLEDRFIIHDICAGKFDYPTLRKKIVEKALIDGVDVVIGVEEAGQQLGFINDLQSLPELGNHTIIGCPPNGDKFNRLTPWAARAESGLVDVVKAHWNQEFFDECAAFTPNMTHKHDDRVDSVSGAYGLLVSQKTNNVTLRFF